MENQVTIKDVAKHAQVSISTVSRVVNKNYPVNPKTKEKVLLSINTLGYKPNVIAQSMKKKKTFSIGVVIPSITNAFFSEVIKGLERYLSKFGYTILLCSSRGKSKKEKEMVEKLISKQVDGIIVADSSVLVDEESYYSKITAIPILFINNYNENYNFVSTKQHEGTHIAINHLKKLGHTNIAFLRGAENSYSYNLKENIYNEIVKNKHYITCERGNSAEAITYAKDSVQHFIKNNKCVTAIFACNDLMAIGAIQGLMQLNYKIPDDIAVIGFDDIYISSLSFIPMTTVNQNMYNLGKTAGQKMYEIINCDLKKVNEKLDVSLVIRKSTMS